MSYPPYPNEILPAELRPLRWLFMFAASNYLVILYDDRGRPLWGGFRGRHKFQDALEALCNNRIYEVFHFSRPDNLNRVYEAALHEKSNPGSVDLPLSRLPRYGDTLSVFPTFPLEDRFSISVAPYFVDGISLAHLHLIRLNPRRFAGVVSIPNTTLELLSLESKGMALADDQGRIAVVNGFFLSVLGLEKSEAPLKKDLEHFFEFSPPLEHKAAWPDLSTLPRKIHWEMEGGFPPFQPVGGVGLILKTDKGWRFQNPSSREPAYFALQMPLSADGADFSIAAGFWSPSHRLPTFIYRGVLPKPGLSPDAVGYGVSMMETGLLVLKRSSDTVRNYSWPGAGLPQRIELRVEKCGRRFRFFLNHRLAGEYADHMPFPGAGEDLALFFLRPGGEFVLTHFEIKAAPSSGPGPSLGKTSGPLMAVSRKPGPARYFHVTIKDMVFPERNCSIYMFEDVTPLHRDLASTKRQRDRLAGLLERQGALAGHSPAMSEVRAKLDAVARSPLSVLIEGETGTGKDVLARHIHEKSGRSPIVKIDCAAIPSELIESELFGYEKGAFTGAVSSQPGKFESARGGTVFLDEVASLPLNLQAKLLNVLQDFKVFRVGGRRPIPLDVRIISASNIPLLRLMSEGRFREDLYYRLNQWRFALPPLRERGEDIPLLAQHFLGEANGLYGKIIEGFAPAALEKLCRAPWRGNIRELRSAVLRAALLCNTRQIEPDLFDAEAAEQSIPKFRRKKRADPALFKALLGKHGGNVTEASREAGISRFTAYRLIEKHAMNLTAFRPSSGRSGPATPA